MSVIATLLPSEVHVHRVRIALRDRHDIVVCVTWEEVEEACEERPVRLLLADLLSSASASLTRVGQLKRRFPQLTVMAYSEVTAADAHPLFDAARAGVEGLIVTDVDDAPRSLLALIEKSEASALTGIVRQSLQGVDETVVQAVVLAVSNAHGRLSPAQLARLLALPRRAVAQRLSDAGFPPPQRLLSWGRLIMAAHLLEDRHRPADRVASSLSFPSGSAFRNSCQRYLHATPRQIRERGGAAFVVRAMMRHAHRAPVSQDRPRLRRPAVAL